MTEHQAESADPLRIPGWGMDRDLYQRACRYLGLTPNPGLYPQLGRYLLGMAATRPAPAGFSRWLAELRPGALALGFLDIWTRLTRPGHPWRVRLNAVLALHECDPLGYREMMAGSGSPPGAWLGMLADGFKVAGYLAAGLVWLGGQWLAYLLRQRTWRREGARFRHAVVLVTGAGRGLGLALLGRLLSLEATVLAVSREGAALQALRAQVAEAGLGDRVRILAADVATPGALEQALREAGVAIDVAIVNAGIKEDAPALQDEGAVKRVFGVNVFGALHTVTALLEPWQRRGSGHFVFISSLGRWHGMRNSGAYNASKAALSLLAESLRIDLRAAGQRAIRVSAVEPGLIRTGMVSGAGLQGLLSTDADSAARRILQCAALGRGVCRFPALFTALTGMLVLMPAALRVRLLAGKGTGK